MNIKKQINSFMNFDDKVKNYCNRHKYVIGNIVWTFCISAIVHIVLSYLDEKSFDECIFERTNYNPKFDLDIKDVTND